MSETELSSLTGVRERSPSHYGWLRQTRVELEDMVLRLEVVRSASSICACALRHQNCEIDEDVANVLQRNVGDRVGDEIDRLNRLLSALEPEPV
jgi:chromosomal replication initiation ATPase DnaA